MIGNSRPHGLSSHSTGGSRAHSACPGPSPKLIEDKAGKIEAVEKVYIRSSAQLIGDIHAAGIIIENAENIKGSIELSRHPART